MDVKTIDGKNLRIWSARELDTVLNLDGDLPAADGSLVVPFASACHPLIPNQPKHLLAEFRKDSGVLVLRCNVCRRPVMAVRVL